MSRSSGNNINAFIDRVRDSATKAILLAAEEGANASRDIIGRGGPAPSAPGQPPNYQTGELYRGISARSAGDYKSEYGTTSKHGIWMEKGVPIIKPIKGKFLPVPVNYAAQVMARRVAGVGLRSQNLKLVVNKAKGQCLLVEQTKGGKKDKKNGAVFVLKRSVSIKPRPWLKPSFDGAKDRIAARFKQEFAQSMGGGA